MPTQNVRLLWAFAAVLALSLSAPSPVQSRKKNRHQAQRKQIYRSLKAEIQKLARMVKLVDRRGACRPANTNGNRKPTSKRGRARRVPKPGRRVLRFRLVPFCPDQVKAQANKIPPLVERLKKIHESDKVAGLIISKYNTWVRGFKSRIDSMQQMKAMQYAPNKLRSDCAQRETQMLDRAKAAAEKPDLDAFRDAQSEAAKDVTAGKQLLGTVDGQRGDLTQHHATIKAFRANHQGWKVVRKNLVRSSTRIVQYWERAYEGKHRKKGKKGKKPRRAAKQVCSDLTKGAKHEKHVEYEKQLYDRLADQLEKDYQAWNDRVKKVFSYDCESMKKMHISYCRNTDFERWEKHGKPEADKIAEDLRVEAKKKLEATKEEMKELSRRRGKLVVAQDPDLKKRMKKLKEKWKSRVREVDRIKADTLQSLGGTRNPSVRRWTSFGVTAHKRMERMPKYQCALADKAFCDRKQGSRKGVKKGGCLGKPRPDCIMINVLGRTKSKLGQPPSSSNSKGASCQIFEFKPDKGDQIAKGRQQLRRYQRVVEGHYQAALDRFNKSGRIGWTPKGGMRVFHAVRRYCANNGTSKVKFEITNNVKTYTSCQFKYQCKK